jgi:hypothetical protein
MDEPRSYGSANLPAASLQIKSISLNAFQQEWKRSTTLKTCNNLGTTIFNKRNVISKLMMHSSFC